MSRKFATAINCIDGRTQTPVLDWMRLHLNVDYVDLITEPGPDKVLALETEAAAAIIKKVKFSVSAHDPSAIAIAAHHDCLGNPVSREEHLDMVRQAVTKIQSLGMGVRVVGLWVNEWGWVDLIADT
jgi:protoporphyrinogen oxidase